MAGSNGHHISHAKVHDPLRGRKTWFVYFNLGRTTGKRSVASGKTEGKLEKPIRPAQGIAVDALCPAAGAGAGWGAKIEARVFGCGDYGNQS